MSEALETHWFAEADAQSDAFAELEQLEQAPPSNDFRQLRIGAGFALAALLIAMMPLFKSSPHAVVPPAPVAAAAKVPSRLQAPDLHPSKPVLVASVSKPAVAVKKTVKPAPKRHASRPIARN